MSVNEMSDKNNTKPVLGPSTEKKDEELTEKQKEHKKFIEELRRSAEKLGHLHPVLKTRFGVVAGNSRLEADPNWPVKEVSVDSKYDFYRLTAGDNFREVKDDMWWADILLKAGNELLNIGTPKGEIAKKLYDDFPIGRGRLLRLLPAAFKSEHQIQAGKASAIKRKANAYDRLIAKQQEEKLKAEKELEEEAKARKRGLKGVFSRYKPPSNVVLNAADVAPTETERHIWAELISNGIEFMSSAVFRKPGRENEVVHDAYVLPIYIELLKGKRGLGFDVEGNKNSFKDDPVRQSYFESRGIDLIWIPKEFAVKYSNVLAEVLRLIM
jgi:hypothetical protein